MKSYEDLTNELKAKNVRLSHQRLKILEYLADHLIHPTADQVYSGLQKDIPTLSKTTVYSTLNTLATAGMVRPLDIEGNEIRYDINVDNHGHFKCESCGKIHDFRVDIDSLSSGDLKGFIIRDKNIYFKGICPACLSGKH
jgi:Fe2+ or Zn2+ uptake regulation protein